MTDIRSWLGKDLVIGHDLRSETFFETGRGLCSSRELIAGDVIVSIRCCRCITAQKAQLTSGQIPRFIRDHPLECLTLFLMVESWITDQSIYNPYLNSLPQTFTNPLFVLRGRIPEEIGDPVRKLLLEQQRDLIKGWKLVSKAFEHSELEGVLPAFSRKRFFWAWFAVATRSLYLAADLPALVPFVDLLNHSPSAVTRTVLTDEGNTFQLITECSYEPGDQIFLNYGSHDNSKLAVYYGFTVPKNPLSEVLFTVEETGKHFHFGEAEMKFLRQYDLSDKFSCSWQGLSHAFLVFIALKGFKRSDYWNVFEMVNTKDLPQEVVASVLALFEERQLLLLEQSASISQELILFQQCINEEIQILVHNRNVFSSKDENFGGTNAV